MLGELFRFPFFLVAQAESGLQDCRAAVLIRLQSRMMTPDDTRDVMRTARKFGQLTVTPGPIWKSRPLESDGDLDVGPSSDGSGDDLAAKDVWRHPWLSKGDVRR